MKTSSVVRYLEAYTFNAFFGQTQTPQSGGISRAKPLPSRMMKNSV
jgi:hypothetical protein